MTGRLRIERELRGWSQREVAARVGMAGQDYAAVESGRRPAWPAWRRRLALIFELSEHELFGTEETETKR